MFLIIDSELDLDCFTIAKETNIKTQGEGDIPIGFQRKLDETIPEIPQLWEDLPDYLMVPVAYKLFHNTYIKHFLKMTQIAYLGTLWLDNAKVYLNDFQIEGINGFTSILFEYDFKSNSWPKLYDISIRNVWEYVTKRTNMLSTFFHYNFKK